MQEDPYGDPQLATLYDLDNPDGPDHAFYRALANELGARSIVDLGCGTGLLTRSFYAAGRRIVGVDPSPTMLAIARSRQGSDRVRWVEGDATAIPQTGDVDLVVCTGNAIQHIGPAELPGALACVAGALRSGGVFSFESRNPTAREWEQWTPETTAGERRTEFGHLREWLEVTEVDAEKKVVFDAHNVVEAGAAPRSGRSDKIRGRGHVEHGP
ncbi:class I SAM-dependent methyltransferase [Xylanimonas oleitrophica]|uniref:Class I SAM-dependent methyltransferase n=1 Tax=Xylanimonas oleitrophica TaxID=2607479 RepID=A0A2W5WP75_9MICO|nr:class I SAM-dependent methyltransferase [Xylanimonas oleitrophica]PZR53369.1 class I SAM-dependent methyltransferase [Xylanimonas oleitrophica]